MRPCPLGKYVVPHVATTVTSVLPRVCVYIYISAGHGGEYGRGMSEEEWFWIFPHALISFNCISICLYVSLYMYICIYYICMYILYMYVLIWKLRTGLCLHGCHKGGQGNTRGGLDTETRKSSVWKVGVIFCIQPPPLHPETLGRDFNRQSSVPVT